MDKPWLESDGWPQEVRSQAKQSMLSAWLFAGVWNLIAWPGVLALPEELGKGNWAALLMLLFPLIGLLLVYWALKVSAEWWKYGTTLLRLDPYPGSIGGHVGGRIEINGADPTEDFHVVLECVYSSVSTNGSKRSRKTSVKWQAQGEVDVVGRTGGVEARFRFDVPTGLPESESADRSRARD